MRFYTCTKCGSLILSTGDLVEDIYCCGKRAAELDSQTADPGDRTHLPVISREGDLITVRAGEAGHPQSADHAILWIALLTREGFQRKATSEVAEATFALTPGDRVVSAYTYCNRHGLFMTRLGGI